MASPSAFLPSAAMASTFAPDSTSIFTASRCPSRAAISNGVSSPLAKMIGPTSSARRSLGNAPSKPRPVSGGIYFVWASMFAPCSSNSLATSEWFSATAHISGVVEPQLSFAFTSAPCDSNTSTASTMPVRAASISGVSPVALTCMSGSAPA